MRYANATRKLSGKVLQRWRGSGGNYNSPVTFTYFICWRVSC